MEERYDAIVVGGGISGCSAAKQLNDHGANVLLLEANDRVGGRTHSIRNPECGYTDLGGAYIGVTQDRLLRMARLYGVKNYVVDVKDAFVFNYKDKSHKFTTDYPPMPTFLDNLDTNNLFRTMDAMCAEIPISAPWKAPKAEEWDKLTAKEFFDEICWTKATREFADSWVQLIVTTEPYEVSLLWLLWYVARCGGCMRIFSCTNGGQERKFIGGTQQISECIADELGMGTRVLLNHPVHNISYDNDGVTVTTQNGKQFQSKYIVLAMAPPLQMRLTFNPPMPASRNQLCQRMPMGSVIKTMTYYDRAYWKDNGMCGMTAIVDDDAIIGFTLDDCKPDGSYPCLMGFILADKAHRFAPLSKEERKHEVAKCYAKIFGIKELEKPCHYEEKDWTKEPWSGGCYTSMMPPGFLTKFGRVLREPVGPIYFAGTETADHWSGYIEGGIEAGERAAREILHAMNKISKSEIWQEEPEDPEVKGHPFPVSFTERHLPSVPGFYKLLAVLGATVGVGAVAYYHKKCKPKL